MAEMTGSGASTPGGRADFVSFLRARRADILAEWEKAARENPRAAKLERLQLINAIPVLFDGIVDVVEQSLAGREAELSPEEAGRHALDRLKEGFDLGEVVTELSLLRDCTLRVWQESLETADGHGTEHQILTRAVDRAIAASVDRYTEARDRMLRALDRVSSTALEARDLDELLEQLVEAFQEEVTSVDTVAILLCDGDVLRVRAARGHEADASIGFVVGDGFAKTIAAERTPRRLRSAATDPLVESELIRSQGTKALYGVPLIEGSELVGVAYMGSSTAEEFSEQDVVLFESMTSRASAGIYQQLLRDRSEERARALEESEQEFEAIFENAAVGMQATPAPREAPQPEASRPVPRRRILIVEDNQDAADMLRELLERRGHEVMVAEDGRQGLDALGEHGADIVLCDLGLPGMSGYDLARAARKDPALAGIPLVAVSGYGGPEDRRRAAEAGFDDHLTKPVDLATLDCAGPTGQRPPALSWDVGWRWSLATDSRSLRPVESHDDGSR